MLPKLGIDVATFSVGFASPVDARSKTQILFEITQRSREVLQVVREQPTIAQFGGCRRIHCQQEIGDEACLRERPHSHVQPFQVHEHANDDVVACSGFEESAIERFS